MDMKELMIHVLKFVTQKFGFISHSKIMKHLEFVHKVIHVPHMMLMIMLIMQVN